MSFWFLLVDVEQAIPKRHVLASGFAGSCTQIIDKLNYCVSNWVSHIPENFAKYLDPLDRPKLAKKPMNVSLCTARKDVTYVHNIVKPLTVLLAKVPSVHIGVVSNRPSAISES